MKHLRKYENFNKLNEELNFYEIKIFVKNILYFCFSPVFIIAFQLSSPIFLKKVIYESLLDVYVNIDKMLKALKPL